VRKRFRVEGLDCEESEVGEEVRKRFRVEGLGFRR
jgi:hypothetical protein